MRLIRLAFTPYLRQVWSLAALLAAVLLSWTIYGFYQPQILRQLDFPLLATWLGIIQGVLAAAIEPVVGWFSDRIWQRYGSRFPLITTGVTIASLLFVAIAFLAQGALLMKIRLFVPVLMTVWVAAMIIFRGPAIALLLQFAPYDKLPIAGSILMLVFGLVGACNPLVIMGLQAFGVSISFLFGAIALVAGAMLLSSSLSPPNLSDHFSPDRKTISPSQFRWLSLQTFCIGFGANWIVNLLMGIFPPLLAAAISRLSAAGVTSCILAISAVLSIGLGPLSVRLGIERSLLCGLFGMVGLMGLTLLHLNAGVGILLTIALGGSFGLVFISTIPFALGQFPPHQGNWGTGLYFGGGGLAAALFSALQIIAPIAPRSGFALAAIGAIFVLFCLRQKHPGN